MEARTTFTNAEQEPIEERLQTFRDDFDRLFEHATFIGERPTASYTFETGKIGSQKKHFKGHSELKGSSIRGSDIQLEKLTYTEEGDDQHSKQLYILRCLSPLFDAGLQEVGPSGVMLYLDEHNQVESYTAKCLLDGTTQDMPEEILAETLASVRSQSHVS